MHAIVLLLARVFEWVRCRPYRTGPSRSCEGARSCNGQRHLWPTPLVLIYLRSSQFVHPFSVVGARARRWGCCVAVAIAAACRLPTR